MKLGITIGAALALLSAGCWTPETTATVLDTATTIGRGACQIVEAHPPKNGLPAFVVAICKLVRASDGKATGGNVVVTIPVEAWNAALRAPVLALDARAAQGDAGGAGSTLNLDAGADAPEKASP